MEKNNQTDAILGNNQGNGTIRPDLAPWIIALGTSYLPLVESNQTESDLKVRNTRLAPGILAIGTQLAPHISGFMSSLIRPLISSIAHRPNADGYKTELLQKFIRRAVAGTRLKDTGIERALEHSIKQKEYEVTLNALKSHEVKLDPYKYYNTPQTMRAKVDKNSVFYQMTTMFDDVLKTRLLSLNHVNSNFSGTTIEQAKIALLDGHTKLNEADLKMKDKLNKIVTLLQTQRHQPELLAVYIILGINLGIHFLGFLAMQYLKNQIMNWFMRQQLLGICTTNRTYNEAPLIDQPLVPSTPMVQRPGEMCRLCPPRTPMVQRSEDPCSPIIQSTV